MITHRDDPRLPALSGDRASTSRSFQWTLCPVCTAALAWLLPSLSGTTSVLLPVAGVALLEGGTEGVGVVCLTSLLRDSRSFRIMCQAASKASSTTSCMKSTASMNAKCCNVACSSRSMQAPSVWAMAASTANWRCSSLRWAFSAAQRDRMRRWQVRYASRSTVSLCHHRNSLNKG